MQVAVRCEQIAGGQFGENFGRKTSVKNLVEKLVENLKDYSLRSFRSIW